MRWVIYCLKLIVAGGLIYWLIDSGLLDLSPLLSAPLSFAFFLGPVALVLSLLLGAWRWSVLLHVHHPHIPLRDVIVWLWIGEFFAAFTPGGGGGEVARAYYIFRNTEEGRIAALSTVVLDRAIGLYSLLFMGSVSFAVLQIGGKEGGQYLDLVGIAVISLMVGISVFFLAFYFGPVRELSLKFVPRRFKRSIASMYDAYLGRKKALAQCFLLSIVSQVFLLGAFFLAGAHLGTPPEFLAVFLVVPLVLLANTLPVSPGGVGIGEAAASILFMQFGMPSGAGIMLIVRLWLMIIQLPGGVLFFIHGGRSRKSRTAV